MTDEVCGVENPSYPGEYACSHPAGHGPIRDEEGTLWDHEAPASGAWWNMPDSEPPAAPTDEGLREDERERLWRALDRAYGPVTDPDDTLPDHCRWVVDAMRSEFEQIIRDRVAARMPEARVREEWLVEYEGRDGEQHTMVFRSEPNFGQVVGRRTHTTYAEHVTDWEEVE